jgi:hypothetical protein
VLFFFCFGFVVGSEENKQTNLNPKRRKLQVCREIAQVPYSLLFFFFFFLLKEKAKSKKEKREEVNLLHFVLPFLPAPRDIPVDHRITRLLLILASVSVLLRQPQELIFVCCMFTRFGVTFSTTHTHTYSQESAYTRLSPYRLRDSLYVWHILHYRFSFSESQA